MKPLRTAINQEAEAEFKRIAAKQKTKPAALLRFLVLDFLDKQGVNTEPESEDFEDKSTQGNLEIPLTIRINKAAKNALSNEAKKRGFSPRSYARILLEKALISNQQVEFIHTDDENMESKIEKKKVSIMLPLFVYKRATMRGRAKGMKISRWIASLAQSNLTTEPVMTHNEINQLNASIRELAAIGRNLNQIAKALNENFYETDRLKLSELNALKNVIDHHKEKVRSLVKSSSQSWGINE